MCSSDLYAIHVDRQIERIFKLSGLNKVVEILNMPESLQGMDSVAESY